MPPRELSEIKNKIKRQQLFEKQKHIHNVVKHKARLRRRREEEANPELRKERLAESQPTRTIENTRELEDSIVQPDDEEVFLDEAQDELANYFQQGHTPKIVITTSKRPSRQAYQFCYELRYMLPNSEVVKRKPEYDIRHLVQFSTERQYTDLIIVNEDKKQPNAITLIHLPDGPTAYFKLSSIVNARQIHNHGRASAHNPEIILNNFSTRLGHSVARMFASLFPHGPQFEGRQVVTFHNQRDFIFIRRHRYIFKEKTGAAPSSSSSSNADEEGKEVGIEDKARAALQEIGPRFTLKLQYLQRGAFPGDKEGEYEWIRKAELETSKKKFFLKQNDRDKRSDSSTAITDGKITKNDPGIALVFNESGLQAHHPNGDVAAAKQEIASAVVKAGMQLINGGEFFTGRINQALAAQDAVKALKWTHHNPEIPDIGVFYFVYPKRGNNVEFMPSRLMFNS